MKIESCENCRHYLKRAFEEPCLSCDEWDVNGGVSMSNYEHSGYIPLTTRRRFTCHRCGKFVEAEVDNFGMAVCPSCENTVAVSVIDETDAPQRD